MESLESSVVRSVGYATADDKRGIKLSESVPMPGDQSPNSYGCSMFIPKSAIRKRRTLK